MKQRFDRIEDDLQKYSYISNLRDRNETLFYRVVMDNIDEMGIQLSLVASRSMNAYLLHRSAHHLHSYCRQGLHRIRLSVPTW